MCGFGVSVPVSASLASSGHDTDASSSEEALTARAATTTGTIPGFASASKSLGVGASTKGEMPRIWEEALSRRVRGVEKSGTVLTSGMKRRVPRKSKKLAKPKKEAAAAAVGVQCQCQMVFFLV